MNKLDLTQRNFVEGPGGWETGAAAPEERAEEQRGGPGQELRGALLLPPPVRPDLLAPQSGPVRHLPAVRAALRRHLGGPQRHLGVPRHVCQVWCSCHCCQAGYMGAVQS